MMDGRVAAIRSALDTASRHNIPILSYASKFASAFYGPFREAADSAPQFGDRRTYQMDGANRREAMREIAQDLAEGADMILMKPAMPYLDIIRDARERFDVPMGAYQVSGEYAMLHAAFQRGWLDPERAMLESLLGIRRAGADFIVTYFAKDAAHSLGSVCRLHHCRGAAFAFLSFVVLVRGTFCFWLTHQTLIFSPFPEFTRRFLTPREVIYGIPHTRPLRLQSP